MLYVNRSSQNPRTANTLRLTHLMEESHRLEIAQRITRLREQSRWTQPQLAEKLGLSLRGYQKLEERGTTKWERAEELGEIHGVSADWIWSGIEKGEAPDVMAELSPDADLLREVGERQAELALRVDEIATQVQELLRRIPRRGTGSGGSPPVKPS